MEAVPEGGGGTTLSCIGSLGTKCLKCVRHRWVGHVIRMDDTNSVRKVVDGGATKIWKNLAAMAGWRTGH